MINGILTTTKAKIFYCNHYFKEYSPGPMNNFIHQIIKPSCHMMAAMLRATHLVSLDMNMAIKQTKIIT